MKRRLKRSHLFALGSVAVGVGITWRSRAPQAATPSVTVGGALLLLRERRLGATILDFRRNGRTIPGARRISSSPELWAKNAARAKSIVLLGDGEPVRHLARLMVARGARVLIVPAPRLEAPDIGGVASCSPREFALKLNRQRAPISLDFSERDEYLAEHLPGARFVSTSQLLQGERGFLPRDAKSRTIFLSCAAGHRSRLAAQLLTREGFQVCNLRGGVLAWEAAKLPLDGTLQGVKTQSVTQGIKP